MYHNCYYSISISLFARKNHRNLLPFHNNSSTPIIKGPKNKPKDGISIDEESKALNSIKEIEPDDFNDTTSTVFFDVSIDNKPIGKIIMQLFDETVQKLVIISDIYVSKHSIILHFIE